MLGHDAINARIACDMAYQHLLVIHEVLPETLIGPIADELLKGHIFWPIARVRRQDGLLHMIC